MFGRRFRRGSDGRLVVRLQPEEVELLRQLAAELTSLLDEPPNADDDPVRARLFPVAYLDPTEEDAESEWQRLTHPDLVASKAAALESLIESLPTGTKRDGTVQGTLDSEHETAWLGVLNDARLAIGTRLGVTEEDDLAKISPDDPSFLAWQVYAWLTDMQADLIEVLLGGMPRGSSEA